MPVNRSVDPFRFVFLLCDREIKLNYSFVYLYEESS